MVRSPNQPKIYVCFLFFFNVHILFLVSRIPRGHSSAAFDLMVSSKALETGRSSTNRIFGNGSLKNILSKRHEEGERVVLKKM